MKIIDELRKWENEAVIELKKRQIIEHDVSQLEATIQRSTKTLHDRKKSEAFSPRPWTFSGFRGALDNEILWGYWAQCAKG